MYDVIVIGGGPAGLTAAIYLGRAARSVALLEKLPAGGQAGSITEIVNYPGFPSVSGYELIEKMTVQAKAFGCKFISGEASSVDARAKTVTLSDGQILSARAIILATGCKSKSLGLSGESELTGSGVSYCATCDGGFFRGKTVAVAGSGEKATEAAEYLKNIAAKVYRIGRGGVEADGVEHIDGAVTELIGRPLEAVNIALADGVTVRKEISGLFVEVGYVPVTYLLTGQVKTDEKGYIYTDENMAASADGIYAAGDIRVKGLRQIVTAASDGAIAAQAVTAYLARKK